MVVGLWLPTIWLAIPLLRNHSVVSRVKVVLVQGFAWILTTRTTRTGAAHVAPAIGVMDGVLAYLHRVMSVCHRVFMRSLSEVLQFMSTTVCQ